MFCTWSHATQYINEKNRFWKCKRSTKAQHQLDKYKDDTVIWRTYACEIIKTYLNNCNTHSHHKETGQHAVGRLPSLHIQTVSNHVSIMQNTYFHFYAQFFQVRLIQPWKFLMSKHWTLNSWCWINTAWIQHKWVGYQFASNHHHHDYWQTDNEPI